MLKLQGIADKVRGIARRYEVLCRRGDPSCSERNFMNEVEGVLEREVWGRLGIPKPEYEYKVHVDEGFVGRHYGRIDAYYGLVLFEYKRPYPGLGNTSVRDGAIRQVRPLAPNQVRLRDYIREASGWFSAWRVCDKRPGYVWEWMEDA